MFAQARLLHATRTIEAAVRNGVLRSEAQVVEVMHEVEAELEQTEVERQQAQAARIDQTPQPAAANGRPRTSLLSQQPSQPNSQDAFGHAGVSTAASMPPVWRQDSTRADVAALAIDVAAPRLEQQRQQQYHIAVATSPLAVDGASDGALLLSDRADSAASPTKARRAAGFFSTATAADSAVSPTAANARQHASPRRIVRVHAPAASSSAQEPARPKWMPPQ